MIEVEYSNLTIEYIDFDFFDFSATKTAVNYTYVHMHTCVHMYLCLYVGRTIQVPIHAI